MEKTDRRACGGCGRFKPGSRYDNTQCRFCWLFNHDERYRTLWGGEGLPHSAVVLPKPKVSISELAAKRKH